MPKPQLFDKVSSGTAIHPNFTSDSVWVQPERDLTRCLGHILRNALAMTENRLEPGEVPALRSIARIFAFMYNDCRTREHGLWLKGFRDLNQLLTDDPAAGRVYGTLCAHIVLSMMAFLYTSPKVLIGSPEQIDITPEAINLIMAGLSLMGPRQSRRFRKSLRQTVGPAIEPLINLDAYLGESTDYLQRIAALNVRPDAAEQESPADA